MDQPAPFQPSKEPYVAQVVPRESSGGAIAAVILIVLLLLVLVLVGLGLLGFLFFRASAPVPMQPPPPTATASAPAAPEVVDRPTPPPLPATAETPPLPDPATALVRDSNVDLLKKLDLTRDKWAGNFARKDGKLISQRGKPDTILLGHPPGDSYDLEIELLRRDSNEGVFVGIVVDGHQAMINIDGFPQAGYRSGLDLIDGQRIMIPQNPTVTSGKLLAENEKQTLLIQVRGQHVTAILQSKTIIDWQGEGRRLSLFPLFKTTDEKQMFLGTWDAQYEFTKIELRAK